MLKHIYKIVILLLFSSYSFAQKGIEISTFFSPVNSWIVNKNDLAAKNELNLEATFSYSTGILTGVNLTDNIGIQSGFVLNKTGQNYFRREQLKVERRDLVYFRVPILLKFNSNPNKLVSFYTRMGFNLDALADGRYIGRFLESPQSYTVANLLHYYPSSTADPVFTKLYSRFVLGVTVESGIQINISERSKLLLLVHGSSSLTNTEGKEITGLMEYQTGFQEGQVLYPHNGDLNNPQRGIAANMNLGGTLGLSYIIAN